jgi:undecaprenyl diphosphate synthase
MDGNGRWAQSQGLSRSDGHQQGVKKAIEVVSACSDAGIEMVTLYAFSQENWKRSKPEVQTLMELLRTFLLSELPTFVKNQVRLVTIGNTQKLPLLARKALDYVVTQTKNHSGMTLQLALSYGGRDELRRAFAKMARAVQDRGLDPSDITEEVISEYLDTAGRPDPDLIVRTSGEFRTSNFLPWQSIYAEYFVTDTLWPAFSTEELQRALDWFATRQRRFGAQAPESMAS